MTRQQESRLNAGLPASAKGARTAIEARATAHPAPAPHQPSGLEAAFDSYLARQARTAGTRSKYREAIERYSRWLDHRHPGTLATAEIDRYLEHWRDQFQREHGRAPASASYRAQINALRAFYSYLERLEQITDPHGRPTPNPMRTITAPRAAPTHNDWLRPAEDAALLACEGTLQERFLVHLLRRSGLRLGEATNLTLADLTLTPGQQAITVRHSKTPAGRRTIPILPQLQPLLHDWLDHLQALGLTAPSVPLLSSRQGTPMPAGFAWRLVKRLAHRAGVRPHPCSCDRARPPHTPGCPWNRNGYNRSEVTPHTLRRTFASHLLNQGLRLEVVSKLLGHANTSITEHAYAQLLDDTTRRELLHALTPNHR